MDKLLLHLVLSAFRIFLPADVDFEKLKAITSVKILMDRRRVNMSWKQKQQKEPKYPLFFTQLSYALFGLFIGVMIMAKDNFMLMMIIFHGYILFMMSMILITDFSSVLLDTTDNQVILTKPVNSKTLFVSRLIHILVYLLQFTIALSIFPVLFIFIKYGWALGIGSFVTTFLTTAFAVFLTYLLYALVLQYSSEQKIRDIVVYFQILMFITFSAGLQILPRIIDFNKMDQSFHLHTYSYLFPPVWMSMALETIQTHQPDGIHLSMIALALLIPAFTFWVMVRYLAPSFSRKLAALQIEQSAQPLNSTKRKNWTSIPSLISNLACFSTAEKGSFEFVWKITSRDKQFKLQFYPSLAYLLVFIFLFVFKSGNNISDTWSHLPQTKMYLFFVYLPIFTMANSIVFITLHENFAASWVYQSTPITYPGQLIMGGVKTLLIRFFFPIYLILFLFSYYIWGTKIIDDFILGFFNNILILFLNLNLTQHYLPFSKQPNIKEQSGKLVKVFLQFGVIGLLILIHYYVIRLPWLAYSLIPVSIICCYGLMKRIEHLSWKKISI